MMVGLCGFALSDKDTAGQIILSMWEKSGKKGFRLAFADTLKEDLQMAYIRLCANRPKGLSDVGYRI